MLSVPAYMTRFLRTERSYFHTVPMVPNLMLSVVTGRIYLLHPKDLGPINQQGRSVLS